MLQLSTLVGEWTGNLKCSDWGASRLISPNSSWVLWVFCLLSLLKGNNLQPGIIDLSEMQFSLMFSAMLYQNSKTSHHSMTRSNCIIILIIVLLAKKSSWDWRPPSATLVWSTDVLRIMVYKMQKCATVASRNVTPVPLITSQGIKYVTDIFHWE